ncbi:MAG: cell wall anchor protein [Neobacillus sp.]|nr:cell wall anchor protein [Neobacillus sp.]
MKFLLSLLLMVTVVFGGFHPQVSAAVQADNVTIHVINGESVLDLPIQFTEGENALDALTRAVNGEIDIAYSKWGASINRIKNSEVKDEHFWSFYINGISSQVNYDSYEVQKGDQLTFTYVNWNAPTSSVSVKVVNENNEDLVPSNAYVGFIGEPTALQLLKIFVGAEKVNYKTLFVNGVPNDSDADSYVLKKGDQITFQYESWGEETETVAPGVTPISPEILKTAIDQVTGYFQNKQVDEWTLLAMKQAGKEIPASYLNDYKKLVIEKQGKFRKITDTERYTLAILAAGGDPTNIEGYNLIKEIYQADVTKQGLIGLAYALLAFDSANFEIPETALWTREKLISYLLERQNQDGGWAWDESATSDIDTTGMIVAALAPYKEQSGVKENVDAAVQYLAEQFQASKIDNSSTAAQVIIALSALGIDANSELFVKDNSGLVQFLLTFQNADGGFDWMGGDESDTMSTPQGIQALVAYQLYTQGKGSLYKLPLIEQQPDTEAPVAETPEAEQTPNEPKSDGHILPNTATDTFNLLLVGLLLLLSGMMVYYIMQSKREA